MKKGLSFREVLISDAQLILDWRTKERVTSFMDTDVVYDIKSQQKWIETCYEKSHYYHWIIQIDGTPIGLINICDYDRKKHITSWGFYLGDDESLGLGGFIPPYLYNFVFNNLDVEKISIHVFANNKNVIDLHKMHGYTLCPELNSSIQKNGQEIILVAMELNKLSWSKSKFIRFHFDFPTTLWNGGKYDQNL